MHRTIHGFQRLPEIGTAPVSVQNRAAAPVRKEPLVGLIRNLVSHHNNGGKGEDWAKPDVIAAFPSRRSEIADILIDFAERQVDYIAIDGGDGTVRDVLTLGAGIFGDSWPGLIILPAGKTNALANDLSIPRGWTLSEALAAAKQGDAVIRQPLIVAQHGNEQAQVRGFVLGAGMYTSCISLGQNTHKLGVFNSAGVAVTVGWSLLQAIFGGRDNPWRRGTKMRLRGEDGRELPHSRHSPVDERYLLFASTLETLPAGARPFADVPGTMRLATLDNSRLPLLLRLPMIAFGKGGDKARQLGLQIFGQDKIDWEVDGGFILDGESFPPGRYLLSAGPKLRFITPSK